ncbi:tRNA uracil 4-sulfurtransferase ThiI [Serpentinicella sp. ANB-PHB4]|uniref:tRNA uracil 4-sulfurtransferase ThiI n=1 Tax=Serpentinicella sp. ANB-PHB4 TaxID=3074076 RepID=UPI0028598E34|nr:tRNA uracil 4-sulfurtransferase ThiI [Serpentinicella sp. ANB-PHB4]MDR5660052.1 tRNA uracil 4-sulfurtransferase ThiI [Serpentinicella sp. ANB-PHB4]
MDKVLIIRYGEIALKGLNKRFFEDKLVKHIRNAISDIGKLKVYKEHSRIYIDFNDEEYDEHDILDRVRKVFGVVSVSVAKKIEVNLELLKEMAVKEVKENLEEQEIKTFKIESKRADKSFELNSLELSRTVGGYVLSQFDDIKVDVHNPDLTIYIEVRNIAFVYSKKVSGFGGLPLGTNGKALLLLSGGIDSPVAGWLVGKRGVEIDAIHFHSYPFTSDRSKEKVIDLAKILYQYTGNLKLYSVNLLPIQQEINEKCPEEEMTILSRRFMMKIAQRVALDQGCEALVTGESIGQVASQTVKSLHVTNNAVDLPVFRPLIAMDKVDIVDLSKKIGTYETSILPFEDCCTVFLPKHPVTRPRLNKIIDSESNLDEEFLINEAISNMEKQYISLDR